ncbi:MAG: AzlC family ABC transporter permease [Rhizobiales bacterium]|nr:AzlC family ABC transporter permease [Hyphomicrobiales bacterium]NRB13426.1 AzlC family ABC transporter permease [Hyphomicrobiales bacterium]
MNDFRRGAIDSLGLSATAAVFATIFGAAAVAKGLSFVEAMSLSAFVFAGSAQFTTLTMWGDTLPFATIVVSCFLITSRNIFMGLALGHAFRGQPVWRKYTSIIIFNDISYVLGIKNNQIKHKYAYISGISLTVYCFWVIGTFVGILIAESLQQSILDGLAYAGIMYLGLLTTLLIRADDGFKLPIILAAMVILVLYLAHADQFTIMIGGVTVGATSNLWLEFNQRKERQNG